MLIINYDSIRLIITAASFSTDKLPKISYRISFWLIEFHQVNERQFGQNPDQL